LIHVHGNRIDLNAAAVNIARALVEPAGKGVHRRRPAKKRVGPSARLFLAVLGRPAIPSSQSLARSQGMFDIPDVKRRSAPRRMARIRCEAVSAEGFVAVGGTLTNVSKTGLSLEADVVLTVGEELYLSFQAPRTTQWVGLVARVTRAARRLDRSVCVAGLAIEEMDPVERSILAAAVERLPTLPRKRRAPRDYAAWVAGVAGLGRSLALH
jgi:hypothetical protein